MPCMHRSGKLLKPHMRRPRGNFILGFGGGEREWREGEKREKKKGARYLWGGGGFFFPLKGALTYDDVRMLGGSPRSSQNTNTEGLGLLEQATAFIFLLMLFISCSVVF